MLGFSGTEDTRRTPCFLPVLRNSKPNSLWCWTIYNKNRTTQSFGRRNVWSTDRRRMLGAWPAPVAASRDDGPIHQRAHLFPSVLYLAWQTWRENRWWGCSPKTPHFLLSLRTLKTWMDETSSISRTTTFSNLHSVRNVAFGPFLFHHPERGNFYQYINLTIATKVFCILPTTRPRSESPLPCFPRSILPQQ